MSAQDIKAIRTNRNELGWLQEQGATASNIPDAWKEYLVGLGYSGSIQDMQKAWLTDYNLDGTLDDKLAKYWAGALQLPFNTEVGSAATFSRAYYANRRHIISLCLK